MTKFDAESMERFEVYVKSVDEAADHLEFLFENLGEKLRLDCSRQSLVDLERLYRKHVGSIPNQLSDPEHLAMLMGQYLSRMIVKDTGARWIQSPDENPMFGHPCLDGFGNEKWGRIYPISLAIHLRDLPETNPAFPGVREKQVLAMQYDKAVKTFRKSQTA